MMTTNKSLRVQANLLHNYEHKFSNLPFHLQLTKLCSKRRYHEGPGEGTVLHDPRRCGTGKIGRLMSRVYSSSRRQIIPKKRMDPWEHQDRSSFGGGRQSSWTLRKWDRDLLVWRWNSFMGYDCEWNKQIRNGNLGRNPREPHRWQGDSAGKPAAKARPKRTPSPTSSSPTITLPYHQRQWIDVEPGKFDKIV